MPLDACQTRQDLRGHGHPPLVAKVPAKRKALLLQLLRTRHVALPECEQAQAVQGIAHPPSIARVLSKGERLLKPLPRSLVHPDGAEGNIVFGGSLVITGSL